MSRVLAVSPHLDDAVFSAGGTLAAHAMAGDEVRVLTCFTGNVPQPTGFALACQLDKGLGPEVDYMALRRAEDEAACAQIGASAIHWSFLEGPHRGYHSAAALFGDTVPGDDIDHALLPPLVELIAGWRPETIYGPYGVGNHVDHRMVRRALEATGHAVIWWEDYPYAMRADRAAAQIVRHPLDPEPAKRKLTATLRYESQLGFQFGGVAEARRALEAWSQEGFARAPRSASG